MRSRTAFRSIAEIARIDSDRAHEDAEDQPDMIAVLAIDKVELLDVFYLAEQVRVWMLALNASPGKFGVILPRFPFGRVENFQRLPIGPAIKPFAFLCLRQRRRHRNYSGGAGARQKAQNPAWMILSFQWLAPHLLLGDEVIYVSEFESQFRQL